MATNTTKSVKNNQVSTAEMDNQVKKAANTLKDQKQVEVMIPKYLKNRLGSNVPVAVNGAVVHVPVGKKVKIPESMAKILNESLNELKM